MISDFIAIDFETANQHLTSVCSVGTVFVREGEIVDSYYSLIHPEPNYYSYFCQRVHGLSKADTDGAPIFPEVWHEIMSRLERVFDNPEKVPFIAHNARFDEGCLKSVCRVYGIDYPDFLFIDTLRASRRKFGRSLPNHQLQTVALACGCKLERHHHALADAEACAAIALRLL